MRRGGLHSPVCGDFETTLLDWVDDSLTHHVTRAIDVLVQGLGIVAISDADDDDMMTLHLQDGSGHVVHLEQGDDDGFRITPEMRQLIERATRQAPGSETTHTPKAVAS